MFKKVAVQAHTLNALVLLCVALALGMMVWGVLTKYSSAMAAHQLIQTASVDVTTPEQDASPQPALATLPRTKVSEIHLDVPMIYQYPELPNGCEATSVTMMLNYAGVPLDKIEVANQMPYSFFDPYLGFVGDPYSEEGSTIYPEAFGELITVQVGSYVNLTGVPFETILDTLAQGKPVCMWIAEEFESPYHGYEEWYSIGPWYVFDNASDTQGAYPDEAWYYSDWGYEQPYSENWRVFLHCVCLTGYDENYVYFNDPLCGPVYLDYESLQYFWSCYGYKALSY